MIHAFFVILGGDHYDHIEEEGKKTREAKAKAKEEAKAESKEDANEDAKDVAAVAPIVEAPGGQSKTRESSTAATSHPAAVGPNKVSPDHVIVAGADGSAEVSKAE